MVEVLSESARWDLVLQVLKLKEQLETTVQKLNESKEVLKTNENGEPSKRRCDRSFGGDCENDSPLFSCHSYQLAEQTAE